MKISPLINMKMPTIVGIFIFISRENFMLSWVEHEKSFITSRPDLSFPIEVISKLDKTEQTQKQGTKPNTLKITL